ncbi:E3 ubiquitin-protein ligase RNF181-like [Neltuma alba]|uniref:E3 ubiquitin-protein ligase RNF181-like n=1 Tax=Neltuma alba TaxID=207710 RepID=UPI0010A39C0B|nr:E3 ubiquitin-protein ligase RNF181-like [Prosopis alba]
MVDRIHSGQGGTPVSNPADEVQLPAQTQENFILWPKRLVGKPVVTKKAIAKKATKSASNFVILPLPNDSAVMYFNLALLHSMVANIEKPLTFKMPLEIAAIDVTIRFLMNMDVGDFMEMVDLEESMERIRMIPATEEAIQSLNKVELGENTDHQCCICFEDFNDADDDAEISTMPCHHNFHKNCIAQWLKTSHVCPLCRYQMPVDNNS